MASTLHPSAQGSTQPASPPPSSGSAQSKRKRWHLPSPIQRSFSTFGGLIRLAIWRIRYYSGLTLLALLGVIIAVGLVTSASFFSQAVDQVMLNRELAEYTRITQRPAFAARVFAPSSQAVPFDLARVETLTSDVADTVSSEVGLPIKRVILLADSGTLQLQPPANDTRYNAKHPLADAAFIYMTGIAENITAPEGAPFVDDAPTGKELLV